MLSNRRAARYGSLAVVMTAMAAVAGCAAPVLGRPPDAGGAVDVRAGDQACALAGGEVGAGTLTFSVTNTGDQVTDFRLEGGDRRVLGEVANLGPNASRRLVVRSLGDGTYTARCRPGMVGDGISTPFVLAGPTPGPVGASVALAHAVAGYRRYVVAQAAQLVSATEGFADAVKAKDVDRAKALYPAARTGWERIEPIAESFDDVDSEIDSREPDARPAGVAWSGFHRLEKDLWSDGLRADSSTVADRLVADVKDLQGRAAAVELTPAKLADGARELLDEMAIVKLGGAEDIYSHTDLWDIDANVDGLRSVVAALRPLIDDKDPTLGTTLDGQVDDLRGVLDSERAGDGFRSFRDLGQYDLAKMSITVNALGRSASRLADATRS